jgi:hypothetical protein
MSSPSEFRPAPPPALDSATYTADFAEVKALGSATGSTRSAEQTEIARFWADGAGTDTPPGHWNRIAATLATPAATAWPPTRGCSRAERRARRRDDHRLGRQVHYQAWRPITAIRAADATATTPPRPTHNGRRC